MSILPMSVKKIKELEFEARLTGHPTKRIAYAAAKREYDRLKTQLFDDEYPYADSPAKDYVDRLRQEAESGQEVAVMRYELMKERRDAVDRGISGEDARELKATTHELHQLIETDVDLTAAHVKAAARLAMEVGSIDNRVIYSAIKKRHAAQKAGEFTEVEDDNPAPITEDDIEAAREKAKQSLRVEDRIAYADIKRRHKTQEIEGAAEAARKAAEGATKEQASS